MAYTTEEGRRRLLDAVAVAAGEIGASLAALGEAHEQLDEQSAEQLEQKLFRPVQRAYALARRTNAEFAVRCGLPAAEPEVRARAAPSRGAKGFVEDAVEAAQGADAELAELQDSMLPVEVGDEELRAGLSGVRELLGTLRPAAHEMLRTLGR
jgi:hypothetical protein